jgi:hypothetical protein
MIKGTLPKKQKNSELFSLIIYGQKFIPISLLKKQKKLPRKEMQQRKPI